MFIIQVQIWAAVETLSEFCNFCPLRMLRTHSALPDQHISLGTAEYLVFIIIA